MTAKCAAIALMVCEKPPACEMAHRGCSAIEIMQVSGHKTLAEAQKYIDAVDQKRMAEADKVAAGSKRAHAVTETGKSHD